MTEWKDRTFTPEQRAERRRKRNEHYRLMKAQGVCVECGKKIEPGHAYCDACRAFENKKRKMRYRERAEHGLCVVCGKPLADEEKGFKQCLACRMRQRKNYNAWKARKKK